VPDSSHHPSTPQGTPTRSNSSLLLLQLQLPAIELLLLLRV
jgi:hypothetical protein